MGRERRFRLSREILVRRRVSVSAFSPGEGDRRGFCGELDGKRRGVLVIGIVRLLRRRVY